MANPITECDRVQSYAAPDPPFGAATGITATLTWGVHNWSIRRARFHLSRRAVTAWLPARHEGHRPDERTDLSGKSRILTKVRPTDPHARRCLVVGSVLEPKGTCNLKACGAIVKTCGSRSF